MTPAVSIAIAAFCGEKHLPGLLAEFLTRVPCSGHNLAFRRALPDLKKKNQLNNYSSRIQ